jgi:hypothetical protein
VRDEFSIEVKETLARRVGMRCSNPNCRQLTCGPQKTPTKAVNVGVAAHITAASKGGKRFDASFSAAERKGIENGIWLCQKCAKLVDDDDKLYTVDFLREWKRLSEEATRLEIESSGTAIRKSADVDLIRFFAQCFDRPAFQDPFRQEGSFEDFDRAIEDTLTALNTGCLMDRNGRVLSQGRGKAFLENAAWRQQLDVAADMLRAIRARFKLGVSLNQIHVSHSSDRAWQCINDPAIAEWMDLTRSEILRVFGDVCAQAGVPAPRFPRDHSRY